MQAKEAAEPKKKARRPAIAVPADDSRPAPAFQTELWPIDRPQDYPLNARNWPPSAITKVAQSIQAFGFRQPIVVDRNGVIIIGHLRRAAARTIAISEVPVHVAADLSDVQVRQLRLMDNRSHEEATWNQELLAKELAELKDIDALTFTGFDTRELDDLLGPLNGLTGPDELPAPTSRPGDIWLLDRHRVACGDSTDKAIVAAIVQEVTPILLVTDPPYGIELDNEWRDRAGLNVIRRNFAEGPAADRGMRNHSTAPAETSYMRHRTPNHTGISNDTRADWSEAFELVPSLEVAYVWHASRFTSEVLAGLERIGFLYPLMIIWNKEIPTLTRTDYWYQHETCWYVRKANAPWFGVPGESTVWSCPSPKQIAGTREEEAFNHPTQKPVAILEKPIVNHLEPGQVVYDPFLGSGSTLIAAHMHERVCFGIDIEPRFVDLVVERWQNFTGQSARLEETNQSYTEVQQERNG